MTTAPSFNTVIESLGTYLPPNAVSTEALLSGCRRPVRFPLERTTGIKFRRMAGETEFAIDLAKRAIEDCFQHSKYGPGDLDLVVCCNISRCDAPHLGFSFEPSTSVKLKKHFGFDRAVVFDISNACAGMMTGVAIVDAFLKAGAISRGLVVSGEYITHLTLNAQKEIEAFMDPRLACLTLGDAGAAVILERSQSADVGFRELHLYTLGRYSSYCIAKATDRPHGGAIMLTDAIQLNSITLKKAIAHTEDVRQRSGWSVDAFQHLIMHQTSKMAIDSARIEINRFYDREICHEGNVVNNLLERGNTASTSYFVALHDCIQAGRFKAGDNLLFSITGSGLTIGTAFYTLDDLPERMRGVPLNKRRPDPVPAGAGPRSPAPAPTRRIRVESVGTTPLAADGRRDSMDLVKASSEDCLRNSRYTRNDIDLLIYAGVYRTDFLFEPAMAALTAGALAMNDDVQSVSEGTTLAFDVFNGGLGPLNACHLATQMIRAGRARNAMIVASEIENNAGVVAERLGLGEVGSALILDDDGDGTTGFGTFVFKYFPKYLDAVSSNSSYTVSEGNHKPCVKLSRDACLEDHYVECIPDAVAEALEAEALDLSRVKLILPAQMSAAFISKLADRLGVPRGRVVDVGQNGTDLFTSSLAYSLQHAVQQERVQAGDIGLIIGVGSGIQVGCVAYYF